MNLMNDDDNQIKYETFQLLYVMVTSKFEKNEKVLNMLRANLESLFDWLEDYSNRDQDLEIIQQTKEIRDELDRLRISV